MPREKGPPKGQDAALWTVAEAAAYLRVSTTTLRRWVHAGLIPYVVIGLRTYRFEPEALDAWMARHGVGSSVGGGGDEVVMVRPHVSTPRDAIRALLRGGKP